MRFSIQTIFHLFSLTIIFSPDLLYLINPSQNIPSNPPFSSPRYPVNPTRPLLDIQSIQPFLSQISSRSNPFSPRYPVNPTLSLLDIQSIQLFLSQISSQSNPLLDIQPIQPFFFLDIQSVQPFQPSQKQTYVRPIHPTNFRYTNTQPLSSSSSPFPCFALRILN